jgi:hypothetical protein
VEQEPGKKKEWFVSSNVLLAKQESDTSEILISTSGIFSETEQYT